MEFEWDEAKRRKVIEERRIDLLYAALIFDGPVLTRRDDRRDYGEERFVSLGMVGDECFVVVHVQRPGVIRLVTAWKGGRDDRAYYAASVARRNPETESER